MDGSAVGVAATARLTAAGWYPGRAVPVEPFLEPLVEEDYEIPPVLREFLRGYGGLEFEYPNPYRPELADTCGIDPQLAIDALFKIRVGLWGERVGAQLVPFGEAGRLFLVMAADGRVWAGFDEILIEIGSSPEDALDALCEVRERPDVPPDKAMNGSALGAQATARLTAAGWHPGRAVPVEPLLGPLLAQGYEITPVLRAFLRSYGGLTIAYPNPGDPKLTETCRLNPERAADRTSPALVRGCAERIGDDVVPFGEAAGLSLFMTADGRVWGGREEGERSSVFNIGYSPENALKTLCEGAEDPAPL